MESNNYKYLITKELLREIETDLDRQDIFIKTILVKIHEIGLEKREITSNLDLGFKLGEIFRMLTEYKNDSDNLKLQILTTLEIVEKEFLQDKKEQNKDGSGSRILLD